MTKPANFPERKRQRQIRALERLASHTHGNPKKGTKPKNNDGEAYALMVAINAGSQREKKTKIDRSSSGRFVRA